MPQQPRSEPFQSHFSRSAYSFLFVQPVIFDVGLDTGRHQIADRFSMPYPFANIGSGHGKISEFQKMQRRTTPMSIDPSLKIITKQPTHGNGSSHQRTGRTIPWARRYNEITKGEDPFKILPGADRGKCIETDNKINRGTLAVVLGEMTNRVDRVGNASPCNLHGRNREAGILSHGQAHHLEPISRRSPGLPSLVRWNRSGNEKNAIEIKGFSYLLRATQMAPMDRIEGAAEEADPHGNSASPFPEPTEEILVARRVRTWQPKAYPWLTSKNPLGPKLGKWVIFMTDHSRICPSPNTINF